MSYDNDAGSSGGGKRKDPDSAAAAGPSRSSHVSNGSGSQQQQRMKHEENGGGSSAGTPTKKKRRLGGSDRGSATPAPAAISELAALGTKTSSQAIGLYEYLKKHRTQTSLLEIETQAKLGNPNFVFSEEIYNHLIKLDGVVQSSSKNGSIRYLQYVPLVDLSTPEKLQQYIRTHSTKKGVPVKTIREEFLGDAIKLLDEWEKAGKILIMRSSGALQLPNPGAVAKKHNLERGSDAAAPGLMDVGSRNWRMVYWDYSRELGESPRGRLESELTQMWADITVEETDDIEKLLATMGHEVSAQEAAKKTAKKGPIKKKKQVARQLNKLTNTHLLAHGIDLSQDYVPD